MNFDISLYLVTDRSLSKGRSIEWIVEEAVKGGVTMVQLREKECNTNDFIEIAIGLKKILKFYDVPLIINDRIDIVLATDADGLHIGKKDMPYCKARKILGYNKIIGISVETIEQAKEANLLDVDYIGISPVFDTRTKLDISAPLGLDGVHKIALFSKHPIVGIGGINAGNANDVIKAGANGVAVVSTIISSENVKQAAIDLKKVINQK